ncbi:MAG TPA: potassium channel family protein [Terriglobales bacterium]|nr:potassium channel family protein [Terriglobales bacterium]
MGLVRQASAAMVLIAATLWLQSAGMAILIRWARAAITRGFSLNKLSPWRSAVLINRFIGVMLVLHILEILLWAGFYRWQCLPTWESCFYFSAASYSTVGYGDVFLPRIWRTLGPVESVVGVIMCGISVSALFAIAIRLIESEAGSFAIAGPRRAAATLMKKR